MRPTNSVPVAIPLLLPTPLPPIALPGVPAAGGVPLMTTAGGVEAIFTALAIHHQISPPTINIFNQDHQCDLDYVPNTARKIKIEVALSNSFGFGGTNGTLILKKI